MSIPAIVLNSSPDIWEGVPIPADAMLTLRGLAFAKAINLGTVLAGHRQFTCCQQALGTFDAPVGEITVRRRVKRLLEHAGKMVRAQLYQLGQRDLMWASAKRAHLHPRFAKSPGKHQPTTVVGSHSRPRSGPRQRSVFRQRVFLLRVALISLR